MRSTEKSNILSSVPGLVMVESGIRTCNSKGPGAPEETGERGGAAVWQVDRRHPSKLVRESLSLQPGPPLDASERCEVRSGDPSCCSA